MDEKKVLKYQKMVLESLSGKIDDFYLAGGTALSLFYFQHRASFDLDFFTRDFKPKRVTDIIDYLRKNLSVKTEIIGQNLEGDKVKIVVYNIMFSPKDILKIDFVEDAVKLIEKHKYMNGINILSLKDIYLRKLYALAGMAKTFDETGQTKFIGGRAEAKDFYDVYYLSHTFMPLAKFAREYCNSIMIEALIRWFRTFDRMEMIDSLLTLSTDKKTDYKILERHFNKEIGDIIEMEISGI